MVAVWVPGSFSSDQIQVLFYYPDGQVVKLSFLNATPIYSAGKLLGSACAYTRHGAFSTGACLYQRTCPPPPFGANYQVVDSLWIR